jgi:hypothetical protein
MRRPIVFLTLVYLLAVASASAATGRVAKVLPHFLDLEGRHALSPSLFDRDAYQAFLRQHPEQRSGIRFDVQWKVRGQGNAPLKLRLELRGTAEGALPSRAVLETSVRPGFFSRWTSLPLTGENYTRFGQVTAWRATLWEGDLLLHEQKSFLW